VFCVPCRKQEGRFSGRNRCAHKTCNRRTIRPVNALSVHCAGVFGAPESCAASIIEEVSLAGTPSEIFSLRYRILFLLACVCLPALGAELDGNPHFESTYVFRTGEQLQGSHKLSYRLTEYSLQHGRWVLPDVGYYDVGELKDRIFFAGGGAEVIHNNRLVWTQILYVAEEAGSAAHHERTFWVWPVLDANLGNHVTAEVALYPTVPLNRAARWSFDVDRAKVEYRVAPHLKVGPGYNACVGADSSWTNKPFATATISNREGDWEFWLQRVPGGAQVQLRFSLTRQGF